MKSIFAVICLIGIAVCQPSPSTVPKPTVGASPDTPAAAPVDVVNTVTNATATQPETRPAPTVEKKGCQPLCKTPLETCVRLARCKGNDCFQCAVTVSIVLPGTKPQQPVTRPAKLPNVLETLTKQQNNQQAAIEQAVLQQALLQQAAMAQQQQQQGQQMTTGQSSGLFGGSQDPFQNMFIGSMMFDGGMGLF